MSTDVSLKIEAHNAGRHGLQVPDCPICEGSIAHLVGVPTAAERKAKRVAVLREGHAAGLHVGYKSVLDCPDCAPAEIIDAAGRQLERATELFGELIGAWRTGADPAGLRAATSRYIQATGDYVLSRLHHNSHYRVAGCTCSIERGGLVGTTDIEDCPKHGPMGVQDLSGAGNSPAYDKANQADYATAVWWTRSAAHPAVPEGDDAATP